MTLTQFIAGLLFAGAHLMVRRRISDATTRRISPWGGPGPLGDTTVTWDDLMDAEHDLYLLNIGRVCDDAVRIGGGR